ncbi:terpenoid synthase [Durotheca rogersii]|uniref:terpenoid synthase n=1 Tax=Durotheca rogersii TaxID=419775 RepID=UPI002220D0F0|nr:terpenoid synthase [Durotheca rogersii]KAI5865168.1 terpenoid synthase [Durotheca rogersii]
MASFGEKAILAKKLKGQRLVIPDMRPIFAHWPRGLHENYQVVKDVLDKQFAAEDMPENVRTGLKNLDPTMVAASWWPGATADRFRVLADVITWFINWDDFIEDLAADPAAAEEARTSTKAVVRQALGLGRKDEPEVHTANRIISSFQEVAAHICAAYDQEQRETLLEHFVKYIDATQLEAEADRSESLPTLKRYWEVRVLTSGMGPMLGLTEYAESVKLPSRVVHSEAYKSLCVTTIVINSIVNDLVSFKKEMKAGSVLSSVAILYQQVNSLDAAVQMSLAHLRQLLDDFDHTAESILSSPTLDAADVGPVSKAINSLRLMNAGNVEWSLTVKRYDVARFIQSDGRIELVL